MNNEELLKYIETRKSDTSQDRAVEAQEVMKFLVVQIGEKKYAFAAEQIKEIVMGTPVYFVPFVPSYIRGFINRYGEPYTVFDLHALFEDECLDAGTFLISNTKHDQIAFLISDVVEIVKIPKKDVFSITSLDEGDSFFSGTINPKDSEVFIINIPSILRRLESNLETL